MTHTSLNNGTNLQEVTSRNEIARSVIAGFSTALPTLARFWELVDAALTDTVALIEELTGLLADLAQLRQQHANLAAAALASLAAHHDGEPDPLSYLRDELSAQDYTWRRA